MRKLLVALGATFVVLLGTGLYQAYRYVPSWASVGPERHTLDRWFLVDATELVHRVGAFVFAALTLAVIALWIVRRRGSGRSTFIAVVVLVVLALATVAELITGRGLRWDQLVLSAVTRSANAVPRGVVLPDQVKHVILGTNELSPSEFSSRVFLHLVLFPVGLLIVGGVLWFLSVRDDRRSAALAGSPSAPHGNDAGTPAAPPPSGRRVPNRNTTRSNPASIDDETDLEPDVTEAPT